jgi:hypothetical protein
MARLKAELARLEAQLAAAPKTTAPSAAPAEDPAPAEKQAPLIGTGPDEPRRVWPWALGAALFGLLVGFALGWRTLDRSIRRKYGGLRIY